MSCLGTGELWMLAIIILIVFSASRMGQLGNAIGRFVYNFRKASKGHDLIDVTPSKKLERGGEDGRVVDSSATKSPPDKS